MVAFVIIGIGGIATAVIYSWVRNQIDPPGPPGEQVLVEIPVGASINDIAVILNESGVVANSTFARIDFRNDGPFAAGEYYFRRDMSLDEAKQVLLGGPLAVEGQTITIPEGLWLTDIRARLLDAFPEFNGGEISGAFYGGEIRSQFQPADINSLEGLLFPDTYAVSANPADQIGGESELIARMVEQMDAVLTDLGFDDALDAVGYSPYEVLIIASMIEEEARVPEDRAKIARVIYNRLERDIALGIDATVLYALQRHTAELTNADLAIDSPYNTRLYKGLPPTPIAAPGRAALEAALNPADGDWIFYVLASTDGSHFFTDSAEEFEEQVRKSRAAGIF